MTTPKYVAVAHMSHDGPWLLIKTAKEIRERRAYIRTKKPKHERALRLRLLKIVEQPLPPQLAQADAAQVKAYAAWVTADAAWVKADAARVKADAAWSRADAAWVKADAAWSRADAARVKAYAAWVKADAAWVKADAAQVKAYAAWAKARAAQVNGEASWAAALVSQQGVAFHKIVCGCAWTPEQPDILVQLREQGE